MDVRVSADAPGVVPVAVAETGPLGALRYNQYRWLALGSGFAHAAYWMQGFVLGWLVIELARSDGPGASGPLYLGLVGLARAVPIIAFGTFGGVLADRFDRRLMLMATRLGLVLTGVILAILTLAGLIGLPAIMAASAVSALLFTVDATTRVASAPMLVEPPAAFSAIGLSRAIMMASSLVGPVIAGVLIGPLGNGWLLVIIAGLDGIAGVGSLRLPSMPVHKDARSQGPWASLLEGIRQVRARPTVSGFFLANILLAVCACSYAYLIPAIADEGLGVGAVEVSWLIGASGLGGLIGAVLLTTMGSWQRPGRILVAHATGLAVCTIALGLQRDLWPALIACALLGWLSIAYYGGTGTIIQLRVPNQLRGRVLALHATIYLGGTQLGTLVIGALGAVIGITTALVVAGVVSLATALVMWRVAAVRDAGRPDPRAIHALELEPLP